MVTASKDEWMIKGFYPAIHNKNQNPHIAYRSYFETYIQKEVRQILNVKNISLFEKFVKILVGRIGNIINFSTLSNEVGASVHTSQSWFSVLEASFICYSLQPYYANINKRLVKSQKLYFYDVGLASYLLGIETSDQMARDPARGALFENLVITEFMKERYKSGRNHNKFFSVTTMD